MVFFLLNNPRTQFIINLSKSPTQKSLSPYKLLLGAHGASGSRKQQVLLLPSVMSSLIAQGETEEETSMFRGQRRRQYEILSGVLSSWNPSEDNALSLSLSLSESWQFKMPRVSDERAGWWQVRALSGTKDGLEASKPQMNEW